MTTHADYHVSGDEGDFIPVRSDHDGRPNAKSMQEYGLKASLEHPWELRLAYAYGGKRFAMMVTKVTHQEGNRWLLEGAIDDMPAKIEWSVVSGQGNLYFEATN
jgi:hypothetical protein